MGGNFRTLRVNRSILRNLPYLSARRCPETLEEKILPYLSTGGVSRLFSITEILPDLLAYLLALFTGSLYHQTFPQSLFHRPFHSLFILFHQPPIGPIFTSHLYGFYIHRPVLHALFSSPA